MGTPFSRMVSRSDQHLHGGSRFNPLDFPRKFVGAGDGDRTRMASLEGSVRDVDNLSNDAGQHGVSLSQSQTEFVLGHSAGIIPQSFSQWTSCWV